MKRGISISIYYLSTSTFFKKVPYNLLITSSTCKMKRGFIKLCPRINVHIEFFKKQLNCFKVSLLYSIVDSRPSIIEFIFCFTIYIFPHKQFFDHLNALFAFNSIPQFFLITDEVRTILFAITK